MQVKEIMSQEVITVKRSTSLKQLLKIFTKFHMFPLVPVVEENDRLVGIVSFRNLINVFSPPVADIEGSAVSGRAGGGYLQGRIDRRYR